MGASGVSGSVSPPAVGGPAAASSTRPVGGRTPRFLGPACGGRGPRLPGRRRGLVSDRLLRPTNGALHVGGLLDAAGDLPELVGRIPHLVVDLGRHHVPDLVLHVPELAEHAADGSGELGQAFRPHHDQRHGEDDEKLEGSYVEHRIRAAPEQGFYRWTLRRAGLRADARPDRPAAASAARADSAANSSAIGWSSSCRRLAVRPSRITWRTRNPSITSNATVVVSPTTSHTTSHGSHAGDGTGDTDRERYDSSEPARNLFR